MGICVGAFCIFLLFVVIYVRKEYKFNPLSMYLAWWGIICFATPLRLRGEPEASTFVYILILLGAICFFFGYIGFESSRLAYDNKSLQPFMNFEINKKFVYSIGIFAAIFLIIILKRALVFFKAGYSLGLIRQIYWSLGDGIVNSTFEYFIAHTIVGAIIILFNCLFAIQIICRRLDKIFIILFGIITFSNIISNGGRMNLVDILFYCIVAFITIGKKVSITKKVKRQLYLLGIILAIVVIYITTLRQGGTNLLITIWSQYTVNIPFMSYLINNKISTGDITYGYSTFGGIIQLIFVILSRFGINPPDTQNILGNFINPFYDIGNGVIANAYTSHLFYFYLDGRMLGVILGSLLFGAFAALLFYRYKNKPNAIRLVRLMIIYNIIYYTFYQWKFVNSSYVLAMLLVGFCFNTSEKYNRFKLKR